MLRIVPRVPLVLALLLSGCYHYTPLTGVTAPEGVRTRVLLTDAGTVGLAAAVGPSPEIIEGNVVRQDDAELTLAVRRVQRRNGLEEFWTGESVTIPRAAVAVASRRELSWKRTALLGVSAIGAVFLFGQAVGGFDQVFGRGGGGPGTTH